MKTKKNSKWWNTEKIFPILSIFFFFVYRKINSYSFQSRIFFFFFKLILFYSIRSIAFMLLISSDNNTIKLGQNLIVSTLIYWFPCNLLLLLLLFLWIILLHFNWFKLMNRLLWFRKFFWFLMNQSSLYLYVYEMMFEYFLQ